VAENTDTTIDPGLVAIGTDLYGVYESGNQSKLHYLTRVGGRWSEPAFLDDGKYIVVAKGSGDSVYFCWRADSEIAGPRRAGFAYWQTGSADGPTMVEKTTNATRRVGAGPGLAVARGMIYLAWSNSSGMNSEFKSQCYLACAPEPGLEWNPRLGMPDLQRMSRPERSKALHDEFAQGREREDHVLAPAERLGAIYYEYTGDPHTRVVVFTDGAVLYMHGKSHGRVALWNGQAWSSPRPAPWARGTLQVAGDGRTVWVVASSSRAASDEVSLSEIVNPRVPIPPA
jgi:hypothetical protein